MLYFSHLQGMERPVRSFESFIRATPTHASPNKPLPPIPKLQKTSSSSSVTTVHSQSRSTGFSLWEAPSSWDNGDECQVQSTPPFALRHYSPLLPEPPEDIAAMQRDATLWQLGNGAFPQTLLHSIMERSANTPEIPARNPSRLSMSLSNPDSTRKSSNGTIPSVSSRYSVVAYDETLPGGTFELASRGQSDDDLPSPLDLASALLDETMMEKALPSSSLEKSRDRIVVWGDHPHASDSLQLEVDAHLDLSGKKLTTFRKASILADGRPTIRKDPDASEKMRALSFAQDYHNVLATYHSDNHAQLEEAFPPSTPPKDRDLTPRPLAWRKESSSFPPAEIPQYAQVAPSSFSGRHKNLKKMSSWVNHHLKKDQQTGLHQRSTSTSGAPSQGQILQSNANQSSKKDVRLSDIIRHGKEIVSRKMLHRESEPKKPLIISSPIPPNPIPPPSNLSLSEAPFQLATPLFRLPGGLAIVRNSPYSTPRPQTTDHSPTSPLSDSSWPDFPASSPFRFDFSRRNSWQSSKSQPLAQASSIIGVKSRLGSSLASPSSLRSFSYSSTSLATPMPAESSTPYNPPQPRRRSHNVGSPLTSPPSSYESEHSAENADGRAPHKRNLFEKARHAREAWRMHQREMRNEKLKQSIRLVGPADASDVAGYIKCGGRPSGDSGIGEGALPGHLIK